MIARNVVLLAAFAGSLAAPSTPSYAFSPEAQQMYTGEAFHLCSSEIPDIPRITACMRNRANLSTSGKTVMDRDQAQQSSIAATRW
jgi:hypothetical protein